MRSIFISLFNAMFSSGIFVLHLNEGIEYSAHFLHFVVFILCFLGLTRFWNALFRKISSFPLKGYIK